MSVNQLAYKKYCDLKIQAMMFDMDIDIETWQLVPKTENTVPQWAKNWREQRQEADFNELFDIDKE